MDNKKPLYWCIQHIDEIGGTEMVSIDLMNHLADYFDITCIVTSEVTKPITYSIDKRIKIFNLGIPHEVTRFDVYFKNYLKQFKFGKIFRLLSECYKVFKSQRKNYQKKIYDLVKANPGKLISSSIDSYQMAPEGIDNIFHFHFGPSTYNSFVNKMVLKRSTKPNAYIFLSDSILKGIEVKNSYVRGKSDYIYNPIRFEPILDTNFNNNRIIFAGRLTHQKNPLLALKIANELKLRGLSFKLDMYGKGDLKNSCLRYINKHKLNDFVSIYDPIINIEKEFLKSDLLLMTSREEGFVLVKGEAAAMSTPCVSSYWGDTVYELIKQNKDGIVVKGWSSKDYADAIMKILKDKETLNKYKEEAFNRSQLLNHKNIITKWIEILK